MQITGAGLGRRLANSSCNQTFPLAGEMLDAAALLWSKSSGHRGRARHWSADPLKRWILPRDPDRSKAAGRGLRGRRISPGEWKCRRGLRLRFVYRHRGPSLLVANFARINKRGQVWPRARKPVTAPIFLLVPQVKLPKRLDLARDADRALDRVPGLTVANWVEG